MENVKEIALNFKQTLESIKTIDEFFDEYDPLDVNIIYNLTTNDITDIEIILGTGGPHISLYVCSSIVEVIWWDDSCRIGIDNKKLMDELYEYYKDLFYSQSFL